MGGFDEEGRRQDGVLISPRTCCKIDADDEQWLLVPGRVVKVDAGDEHWLLVPERVVKVDSCVS